MPDDDVVVWRARLGVELLDAVTGGPLIGPSDVTIREQPTTGSFIVNRSRWVFEELEPGALTIIAQADRYVRAELPIHLAAGDAVYLPLRLAPAITYPFQASHTRVTGQIFVRVGATTLLVDGRVTITPHRGSDTLSPMMLATSAGQYVSFFTAAAGLPDRFDMAGEAVVDGVTYRGELLGQPIVAGRSTTAAPLVLA